jgi:hypothetical protein
MRPAKSLQRNAQVAPNSLGSPGLLAAIDSIWRARFFVRNVLARHRGLRHLVLEISVEPLGQQIVDRHVVSLKPKCTTAVARKITRDLNEDVRERVRGLANTEAFQQSRLIDGNRHRVRATFMEMGFGCAVGQYI